MIGLGLSLTTRAVLGLSFNPATLFAAGEQGILADPSDLSTLFADTAGTTPVTAPGQTVALALDKSKGLVLGPELVTNGGFATDTDWTKGTGWSIGSGVATHTGAIAGYISQGGVVAGRSYRITVTITASDGRALQLIGAFWDPPANYTIGNSPGTYTVVAVARSSTIWIYANNAGTSISIDNISVRELPGNHLTQSVAAARPIYGRHPARGYVNQLVNSDTVVTQNVTVQGVAMTLSFTGTGTITLSGATTAGPLVGTGASDRVSLAFTPSAGTLTLTVSGDVRLGQLERGTLTAYQRTGASNGLAFPQPQSYDITEAGVPNVHYLFCDGLARWMVSPTITPGIDKVQVIAGVRKLSDAAIGIAVELSTSTSASNGAFYLATPVSTSVVGRNEFSSKGTTAQVANAINAAPNTNVLTGLGDIAADNATLRVNGAQAQQNTADQGSGNFLAYPLFVGARGGTSLFLNGLIYSIVVRFGSNLPTETIQQVERWTAQRTGVTLP